MARLGDYVTIRTGKLDANASSENGKYPFFTCSVTPLKIDTYSYYCECVLVAGNGDLNVKYYNGKFDAYQRTYIIESNDKSILSVPYLYCFLDKYVETLRTQAIGGVIKYIKLGNLIEAQIPLISLEEQNKIVENFSKINALTSYTNKQLEKLDELVKSRFIELFGDPEDNPKKWSKETLSNHLNVVGGYAFKSDSFLEEGIPVLRIGNINAGFFKSVNMVYWQYDDSLSRYMMYAGDLVMSLTGTVGKDDYGNVCILGNDYNCYYLNQRNAKLELFQTIDKYYLSQILKFPAIKKKLTGISRGVRQANISNKDILNLEIPIPPIELQNEFADFVKEVDKSKFEVQQSLEKLETLKKSLMQQYFG